MEGGGGLGRREGKGTLATKAHITLCRPYSEIASKSRHLSLTCHVGTHIGIIFYGSMKLDQNKPSWNISFLRYCLNTNIRTDHFSVKRKRIPFNLSSYLETKQTWSQ